MGVVLVPPGTVTVAFELVDTVFCALNPVAEPCTVTGAGAVTGVDTLLGPPFAPAATAQA